MVQQEDMEICVAAIRDLPAGFALVREGSIRKDDLVWNDSDFCWVGAAPPMINDDVDAYYGVARKA